ncbi:hypothetical protein Tco_1503862 [Tanacetum coccineum]
METQKVRAQGLKMDERKVRCYICIGSMIWFIVMYLSIVQDSCVIMFRSVCTSKGFTFHAVKGFFRYLKGQLKLGLGILKMLHYLIWVFCTDMVITAGVGSVWLGRLLTVRIIRISKEKLLDDGNVWLEWTVPLVYCHGQQYQWGEQLHALVDGKKIIITESSVRKDLQLADEEGVDCLPNSTIYEQLTLMGPKTATWNEFSSTMASTVSIEELGGQFGEWLPLLLLVRAKQVVVPGAKKPWGILLLKLDEEVYLLNWMKQKRLPREEAKKEVGSQYGLIETWDDIQAKIDVDHQLAERMQAQEQEELSIEEKGYIISTTLLRKRRKIICS